MYKNKVMSLRMRIEEEGGAAALASSYIHVANNMS